MNQQQQSLELLEKYLSRTSSEELASLIKKYESFHAPGPTVAEYFENFGSEYQYLNSSGKVGIAETSVELCEYLNYEYIYSPPPIRVTLGENLEDSVIFTESFFLV